MEMKTERKEEQWKDSISQSSSSRCSSITSDSSDGHFEIRHFPLPKPTLSASEAQKQRELLQAYNSSISSYTSSSWSSICQNLPGYDSNRIPSSVFSSKPTNSTEWSITSNESLFSLHDVNFNISTSEDHGFDPALRSIEITEIKPVPLPPPLPPVIKPTEPEKETITEMKPDSEIDEDEEIEKEEMDELEIEDDLLEEDLETKKPEENVVEDVKENKPEDSMSIVSHSRSISCRSDTSNNSIHSFAFPPLQEEEGVDKTPSMAVRGNVSLKRTQLPQSLIQAAQPQTQCYSASGTTKLKTSKQFESQTQSPKARRNGWFSCFHCSSKRGLFK